MAGTLDDALAALDDSTEAMAGTQSTPSFSMPKVQTNAAPTRVKPVAQSLTPGDLTRPVPTLDDALMLLDGDETEPLRDAVNLGTQKNPATSTRVLQLFGKTDLPKEFIEDNLDFVEQESAKQDFNPQQLMKDSPAFASWLAEHPDHVAAAKPDVGLMSYIERQIRYIGLQGEFGPLQMELSDLGQKAFDGTITAADRKRQGEIEARLADINHLGEKTGITGIVEQVPGQVVQQLPLNIRTMAGAIKEGAKGLVQGAMLGGIAGTMAGGVGALPGAIAGGALGASIGATTGAMTEAGKAEMHQAYLDYEKLKDDDGNPLDRTTIRGLALMVGTINGAIEGLTGTEQLGKSIPGIRNFTRQGIKNLLNTPTARQAVLRFARTVAANTVVEGATEAVQMYFTKAGGVIAQALKDGGGPTEILGKIFTQENFDQAVEEARAGAQGGGGMAVVATAPQVVADLRKARQATQVKEAFESIGKAVEGMKFAHDLPGPLRDIIARATKDGSVYMPTKSFNTYFQAQGVDPRAVYQEITGDVEAYDQAVERGVDLPIKTADYIQKLAGTKHNAFLVNELRDDIDAMNARESEQWAKDKDAQAEADAAAIAQPGIQALNLKDPVAAIRKEIAGQLQSLGFDPTVVDQYAALTEARYRARAEKRGLGESAADLFRQENLSITRPLPPVLQQLGKTTELDALLDRLRSGDIPRPKEAFGQSLAEFLKEAGGVQDQGGELSARNVDKNRKAFKKKLVQKGGLTLDEAAQRAVEAGYIEDRDIGKLLAAIDQEVQGTPVFAVGKENARALDVQTNLESLKAYLDQRGIDLKTATNADIKKLFGEAVQQTIPTVDGQTFAQGDVARYLSGTSQAVLSALKTWHKTGGSSFGTSEFLLPDGTVISAGTSTRYEPYNHVKAIEDLLPEALRPQASQHLDTFFKESGSVRIAHDGNALLVELHQPITHRQKSQLHALANEGLDSVVVDDWAHQIHDTFDPRGFRKYLNQIGSVPNVSLVAEGQTFAQGGANIDPMATERGPGSSDHAQTSLETGREKYGKFHWSNYVDIGDLPKRFNLTNTEYIERFKNIASPEEFVELQRQYPEVSIFLKPSRSQRYYPITSYRDASDRVMNLIRSGQDVYDLANQFVTFDLVDSFGKLLGHVEYDGRVFEGLNSARNTETKKLYDPMFPGEMAPNPSSQQHGGPTTLLQTFNEGDEGRKGAKGKKSNRAEITFGDAGAIIRLLENADLSSFIHESGHLYLNELITDATTAGVPQQLRDDLDTILKWVGLDVRVADGADAINGAIKAKHHEKFAEGFENYVMEGKSPSQAMREAFAAFRQWMIQVYKSLVSAYPNVKLTKDVREVMDRMIATDEEIDAAAQEAAVHPMFLDAESAGMTPTKFAAYREAVAEASLSAREDLQLKLMKQYQRQNEKWWKEQRAAKVEAITAQVNDQNEYVALAVLQTGKFPDGSDLAEGIEPMKLDKKAMRQQFGEDFMKRLPKGITGKDGMHPDAAAPIFGYNSGTELVEAIVNARPKNELIEAEADAQMKAEYGDMLTDGTIAEAARAAVNNEQREQVIAAEIRALNAKAREVKPFVKAAEAEAEAKDKAGRNLLRTIIPSLKDTRELARKILSRAAIKTIKPNEYMITARQASRNATAALTKRDYLDAGKFKQSELLNLALYREANIIQDQVESATELASDFFGSDATLAKTRNVDLVNVGRAILAQHKMGPITEKTAAEYLKPILTYDKDLYDQWAQVVDALAPREVDYRALTVEEFTRLHDDMKALWLLSRRTQQMKVNDQLVDRDQAIAELSAVMAGFTRAQSEKIVGPQTSWTDTKVGLLSWGSALRRVESWVDAMDGGAINGPFRRYIWTPISEASDLFRSKKKDALKRYLDLIKPIEGTIHRDLIPAPELGPGVSFRGRAALLHAVLHTGNESNYDKLLRGYKWDKAAFERFIDRAQREGLLTKADYDYAQGVWDLLESVKPDAQKAHHEMYGFYFNEITAKPVMTTFGEYRGGYVPAIADRFQSVDQAIREEKDLFDQGGNSFMFPTTGRGFTKSRVEQYAAPLALDLTTIPVHLDKTMRFIYLEPRVKDAARLVTNKGLRQSLDAMNSTVAKDMLVPWLQRSAQQTVSTPGRNRHADQLFRYMRKTSGAQIMVGNVLNTLQQYTGLSISLLKVRPRYMRGSLMNYLRHPVQYADDIASRSLFMKERTSTQVMEIQATIDDILLNPTKYDKARKFAERHGYFLQQGTQGMVDLITWGGAYDQAHAQGLDERMAVRSADSAVRETQGSFAPEDLSNFEAGTPFTRAFTMFYSYFNMQANLLGTEFSKVAHDMGLKRGAGRAFYIYLFGFMIPAVLAETIVKGIGGFDPDDDDDYLNETLSVLFGSQLRSALAFFPGVGPATLAGINMFNDKWYDDRISTSPVVSLLESAVRAPHSLYKAMSDDGHSKRAVKDVLTLIGLVTGLPAGSLARPLGYAADVADGVARPEDVGDVARGLISGRDVNRKK
jgi:hypothetical protein